VQTSAEVQLSAINNPAAAAAAADGDDGDDDGQFDDDDEDEADGVKDNNDNDVLSLTELLAESRRDRVQSKLVFSSLRSLPDLFLVLPCLALVSVYLQFYFSDNIYTCIT